jgi:hypothetical protein
MAVAPTLPRTRGNREGKRFGPRRVSDGSQIGYISPLRGRVRDLVRSQFASCRALHSCARACRLRAQRTARSAAQRRDQSTTRDRCRGFRHRPRWSSGRPSPGDKKTASNRLAAQLNPRRTISPFGPARQSSFQLQPVLDHAAEMILVAGTARGRTDVVEATPANARGPHTRELVESRLLGQHRK